MSIQEESSKLKEELDKKKVTTTLYATKCKRKGRSCDPPPSSIRNIRVELTSREKEIQQLTKQLDEIKKINKKLLKDKENYYLSFKEQSAGNYFLFLIFKGNKNKNKITMYFIIDTHKSLKLNNIKR